MDVSTVQDFHGSADYPSVNGTLRHQDIDLALSQRAQEKVDKYREGYAAPGLRHSFLPAIVSTSGRIHGELLRLHFVLADKKTTRSFKALGEAVDVDSAVYCWRRSGVFCSEVTVTSNSPTSFLSLRGIFNPVGVGFFK